MYTYNVRIPYDLFHSDGKNHSACCQRKGVPNICLDFCSGLVLDLDNDHITCLPSFDDIIDCMEEGQDLLPSPPQHLRGRTNQGALHVFWHEPAIHQDRVQFYEVHYVEARVNTTGVEESVVTVVSYSVLSHKNLVLSCGNIVLSHKQLGAIHVHVHV